MTEPPDISVVVPSHDRPLRLRWLLNALEEQTLPRDRWEVVVAHDSDGPETEALLSEHPLAKAGVLRHVTLPAGSAPPARNRNVGWRAARAPLVAFTDDDCRPPREWLELALAAARRHDGAIVQGTTMHDPEEERIARHAPWIVTQSVRPPSPQAETCNIVYPRAVLEEHGGFDEGDGHRGRGVFDGEDTDLAERARAAGTPYVGAPEVLTWHAVQELSLPAAIRRGWRWRELPFLLKRHPRLRGEFTLYVFYTRRHAWLPFAVAGAVLQRRNIAYGLLAVPYVIHALPTHHGSSPRSRLRSLSELPGRFAIDASEFLALAWGSLKHRTLFL